MDRMNLTEFNETTVKRAETVKRRRRGEWRRRGGGTKLNKPW
ncbi:MAG: hypothetical protein SCH70_07475 [Candidatus Methanoperedens sp.]|nr:hypothetical protein [Candidatus Methanoperedens sp.]